MRQLAVYLTRVQPAKLNITWGLVRVHLLSCWLASTSRSFLERVAECPHGVALPLSLSLSRSALLAHSLALSLTCSFIRECQSQNRRLPPSLLNLPVTFCAPRSVIAARCEAVNCRPLLPDLARRYMKPSTVWDRQTRAGNREKKRAHLKKYRFVILFVSRLFPPRKPGATTRSPDVAQSDISESRTKRRCRRIDGGSIASTFGLTETIVSSCMYVAEGKSQGRAFKPRRCLPDGH